MDIQKHILSLGFVPKNGTSGVYQKIYAAQDNYSIEIDFEKEQINYGSKIKADCKTTQNFTQSENFVVLECVNRLLEKGYKPENIVLEKTWAAGHGTSGRLDICVTRDDGSEYMLIECKTFGKEFDKELANMQKNGGQLFTYFKFSSKADVLVLYASELKADKINYISKIVKIEDEYRSGDVKDFYDKWNSIANKAFKDNGVFDLWVKPYNFESKALTISDLKNIQPEDSSLIFNSFLEILRHNVVSDKPNAFNKIFTLFLCKIYDEKIHEGTNDELNFQWLEGVDDNISFQLRLTDLYKEGMKDFLEKEVSDFSENEFETKYATLDQTVKKALLDEFKKIRLEKNNEFAIKEVYDKKSFEENAVVVKQVVKLLQGYRIRYAKKQQYLSDFFELLLTTGLKQESGQFFTPVPIAQFIIRSLPVDKMVEEKLKAGKRDDLLPYIMDYAAGSGHFITESMHVIQKLISDINLKDGYIPDTQKKIKAWQEDPFDWASQYEYGIEKDYRLVKVGKVGCYLHGDGLANVIHSDGLAGFDYEDYKGKLRMRDSVFKQDNKQFDILISNPPYSVSAFKNAARQYYGETDFELYKYLTDQSSEIECLFVERAKQLLKDGGIAGIILPSSILSNAGIYTKTREIILKYFEIIGIAELGSNTFMATNTNTIVLFMRRRNNYEVENIQKYIDKFFETQTEVTINGIEKPITKYLSHVWNGVSLQDYADMLKGNAPDTVKNNELYKEYAQKLTAKTEDELNKKIADIEREKILYFILAYNQQVVVVKTGSKDEEKRFLGYEFSNRRGNEGIHAIQRGKTIDECTKLYDDANFENPQKASTYIYDAFTGKNREIDETLQNNITRSNLVDMLTFDRADFEKTISLSVKKKVEFESKWNLVPLENIANFQSGLWKGEKGELIPVSVLRNTNFKLNNGHLQYDDIAIIEVEKKQLENRTLQYGDIILEKSGGSETQAIGRVALFNKKDDTIYSYSNFCSRIRVTDFNRNNSLYLWIILNDFYKRGGTIILQNGIRLLNIDMEGYKKIKIPLPPKDVQEKIVAEIEKIEAKEQEARETIEKYNNFISNGLKKVNCKEEKLENIATLIKRGKSAQYGNSNIQIIKSGQARGYRNFDFSTKYYVNDKFTLDERKLENGDILINSTGVGTAGRVTLFNLSGIYVVDSHITILRLNQNIALPTYTLYALADGIGFKNIEAMAQGQSGQIELAIKTIQNIKIPVPPLAEQQKIVSEIEKIETQITEQQQIIDNSAALKSEVLKKYL